MKKFQIIGFAYIFSILGAIYLLISNKFAINDLLIFVALVILATYYFLRIYKSKTHD